MGVPGNWDIKKEPSSSPMNKAPAQRPKTHLLEFPIPMYHTAPRKSKWNWILR